MNRQRPIRDDGHTKLTRLYNIIVIFLRCIGLTFGGITIDSKAKNRDKQMAQTLRLSIRFTDLHFRLLFHDNQLVNGQ